MRAGRAFVATAGLVCSLVAAPHGAAPLLAAAPPQPGPQPSLAAPPVRFEANVGQSHPDVDFVARGPGYALFLTPTEAVLVAPGRGGEGAAPTTQADVVRIKRPGANPASRGVGGDRLAGVSNYFIGSDPGEWRADVPAYGEVRYADVYPGIDLLYHGRRGVIEYDFELAPGADADAVVLEFEGPQRVEVADSGELVVTTGRGELRQPAPVIYQDIDGERRPVPGGFKVKGRHVSFWVGAHDPAHRMVIDPMILYSGSMGGSGADAAAGVATDRDANTYLTGRIPRSTSLRTTRSSQSVPGPPTPS